MTQSLKHNRKKSMFLLFLALWLGALPTVLLLQGIASLILNHLYPPVPADLCPTRIRCYLSVAGSPTDIANKVGSALDFVAALYLLFGWIPMAEMFHAMKKAEVKS